MSENNTTPTTVNGSIKIGKHTAGHAAWLRARGYTVVDGDGKITVKGTAFVTEIDLTAADGGVAVLKDIIAKKALMTYSTKAKTAKGERSSIMLCTVLGPASALMVKPAGAGTKAAANSPFAAL